MDPYNEVRDDAWATIKALEALVDGGGDPVEFENNYEEFEEIQRDLEQAVQISERDPDRFGGAATVRARRDELEELARRGTAVRQASLQGFTKGQPQRLAPREVTTMSNRISQDENPFSLQSQQVIREQDTQLDSIHHTMRTLNQQASMMGSELEEQGFMLDELDHDLDQVDSKLQRGLKRVNVIIERNREKASDWCIGILAFALCILLILVIAL
ncbi:uncharacterized protein CANTADRAFT_6297 [Suhomyces tanzawaensis NRRL Y-17324]|uniref:t-SNARE affecting a late Golgi compartment protein 1 n=1 Tax=Suhomyces tanzawaensis NRRL Y-17324 TaxID=984487 RepID=A0A1E4SHZ3_9ASCO|nr:uncharacterized protein CANTADRAFT_6297 [Suhomyces tanzawaensis NRRL Y-17324]ODV79121.1 hypothetical protein CANTADRAFT_6297 [Suhomyces tanzawaensis NRRL Y-17324]